MGDGGKGSSPRPFSVSQEKYGNNFDAIFGKKVKPETKQDEKESTDENLHKQLPKPLD
jgi:hypothetical protein